MSFGELWIGARYELADLLVGSWETRHSLFAHFVLYGALFAALGVAMAPLSARARTWGLAAFSVLGLAVLGSTSMALNALAFSVVLHFVIERIPGRLGTALAWLLVIALAAYPFLLPADILTGNPNHMREFWAFASNVWWLRCVAYLVDRRSRGTSSRPLCEFLLATLFFPTFVNGPIETTEQLAAHRRKGPAVDSWAELRAFGRLAARSILRILWGVAKVLFTIFFLGQDNETIFSTSGTAVSHPRLWLWAAELYATFYITFSGWTDVSIGLSRLVGFDIAENFDRPWRSRSVAEFWRRWHITFGVWLRGYVYLPLGGNRRHGSLNVMITFLVSGLWHVWGALKVLGPESYPPYAWLGFVIWGLMNGAAVVVGRWWNHAAAFAPARHAIRERVPEALRDRANQLMAFWFVAIAWIPFFLPPWVDVDACRRILLRLLFVN